MWPAISPKRSPGTAAPESAGGALRHHTFHHDRGELHGITVVVDTEGPEVYVGRCDDVVAEGVILHDADQHCEGDGGRTKDEYLARAAEVGFWKKYDRLVVAAERVKSIRRLAEL